MPGDAKRGDSVTAARRKPPERVAPAAKQAVDAPRQSVFLVEPEKLTLIGYASGDDPRCVSEVDTKDGPEHCLYDETIHDEPDDELAESLGEFGQRQTLVVRKNGAAIEVVSGRTRTKSARVWNEANPNARISLACMFARGKDETELLELMIVENEHRKDKPPIVKAKQALRLKERGRSDAQIAKVFRTSLERVHTWLGNDSTGSAGLVDAAQEIQQGMEAGEVSIRDAQAVASMPHKDQAAALELARESGQRLADVVANTGGPQRQRQRGSSHNPSSRPPITEIRAELEDDTIADADVIGETPTEIRTHILKWVLGDVPHLNRRPDADKDDAR
jgi:ParB-like chromosome segregation protein Spo0J